MKVGFFIGNLKGGGAERVVTTLVHHCSKEFDIVLFTLSDISDYTLPEGVNHVVLISDEEKENWSHLFIYFFRIPKLLSDVYIKYDLNLLLTFNVRPNIYASISKRYFLRSMRLMISERSFPSMQYRRFGLKSAIMKRLIKYFYPIADIILTNAEGNKLDLKRNFGLSKHRIVVVNNPVDEFVKPSKVIDRFAVKRFISVGRLDVNKNFYGLVKMFSNLSRQNWRLDIFGEGPEHKKIKDLINELGLDDKVELMGFDSDIRSKYRDYDAFVFLSLNEGFPNVLLEAAFEGIPIFTHDCPSGPSEIMLNKVFGINRLYTTPLGTIVPYLDVESLAYSLDNFIENGAMGRELNEERRSSILSRFHVDIIVGKYTKIVREICVE